MALPHPTGRGWPTDIQAIGFRMQLTATSDLWAAALELLEPRYNKPVFEMWLKPMRLVELTPNEIVLAVNTSFARDWVENRLKHDITSVLHDILGAEISLRVVVDAGPGTESVPTSVPAR